MVFYYDCMVTLCLSAMPSSRDSPFCTACTVFKQINENICTDIYRHVCICICICTAPIFKTPGHLNSLNKPFALGLTAVALGRPTLKHPEAFFPSPACLPALQPSSLASSQPSSLPALRPCSLPALQPSSPPALQPPSLPAFQPSSLPFLPALQPSSLPPSSPSCRPPNLQALQPSSPKPSNLPAAFQPSRPEALQPSTLDIGVM